MSSTRRTCAAREVEVEVLHDAHDAARAGRAAVGRDRHEVELDRQVDRPGEVAHEHERALEHADEQRRGPGVVGGDLGAELGTRLARSSSETRTAPRSELPQVGAATVHRRRPYRHARGLALGKPKSLPVPLDPPPVSCLGGDRLAPSDREHPLDGRGVRRVAVRAASRRTAAAGEGEAVRRAAPRRRWDRCRAASASSRSASSRSRSAWRASTGADVAPGDVVEQRAAARGGSGCGGTAGRRSSGRRRRRCRASRTEPPRLAAAQGQHRAPAVGAHRREAVEAGAAQQVEQHRLGLVVGGVAE